MLGLPFRRIWCIDFEFIASEGENPQPVCLVAKEVGTGRLLRLWQDQLGPYPPFEIDDDTLVVAYYAPAEIGCFLALGWPVPTRIIDLYAEFRRETNALAVPEGRGLLAALSRHRIAHITSEEKRSGRDLVLRGRPWTDSERRVQSCFSSSGAVEDRVFTGSRYLLGEFGWLAAVGMLILGVGFAWWHFRTPTKDGLSPKESTGYKSPVMWLWFRNTPKHKVPAAAT